MGNRKIIIISLIFVLWVLPSLQPPNSYNTFTRTIHCTDLSSCLHETGHAVDDYCGWVSHSRKFRKYASKKNIFGGNLFEKYANAYMRYSLGVGFENSEKFFCVSGINYLERGGIYKPDLDW